MKEMPPLFKFEERYKDPRQQKLAIRLKVVGTGSLELDHCMMHPFVKVHIVDLDTYKYLAKSKPKLPGIANKESASFLDTGKHLTRSNVDYIMPFSTQIYDLRVKGMNIAEW